MLHQQIKEQSIHRKYIWGIPSFFIILTALSGILAFYGCQSTPKTEHKTECVGGYTQQREITEEELSLFKSVTADTEYGKYVPETVATQIVAGINLRFTCSNGRTITIHKPLPHQGEPRILEVK